MMKKCFPTLITLLQLKTEKYYEKSASALNTPDKLKQKLTVSDLWHREFLLKTSGGVGAGARQITLKDLYFPPLKGAFQAPFLNYLSQFHNSESVCKSKLFSMC